MLRREDSKPFERRGHDLDLRTVRVGELAIERVLLLAIVEHDTDVPVRALVDHEVPSTGAEDVQPDNLLAGAGDLEQILERRHDRRHTYVA